MMKKSSPLSSVLFSTALLIGSLQTAGAQLSETFDNCMENSDGMTETNLACIAAEYEIQDQALNDNYQSLMSNLDDESKTILKTAQRAWITFRDNNCQLNARMVGGQMSTMLMQDCYLQITAERASELQWMEGMFSD